METRQMVEPPDLGLPSPDNRPYLSWIRRAGDYKHRISTEVRESGLRELESPAAAMQRAFEIAADLYLSSDHAQRIAKRSGLAFGQVEQAVRNNLISGERPEQQVDLYLAIITAQKIGRDMLINLLDNKNKLKIDKIDEVMLREWLDIAGDVDRYAIIWGEKVGRSQPVLDALGREPDKVKAKRQLVQASHLPDATVDLDYLRVVFEYDDDGNIKAIPYKRAFAEHRKVTAGYKRMREGVAKGKVSTGKETEKKQRCLKYLDSTIAAFDYPPDGEDYDPVKEDELWRQADTDWVLYMRVSDSLYIQTPLVEVGYKGPLRDEVEPGGALGLRDDREKEVIAQAQETLDKILPALLEMFPDGQPHEALMYLYETMKNSQFFLGELSLAGGNFIKRALARNLPNYGSVRKDVGVVIVLDQNTYRQRRRIMEQIVKDVFGEDSKEAKEYLENEAKFKKVHLAEFIRGHETLHSLAIQAKTYANQKGISDIEEFKCDIAIAAFASLALYRDLDEPMVAMRRYAYFTLFESLRSLKNLHNQGEGPYVDSAFVFIDLLLRHGLLSKGADDKWQTSFTDENVAAYFSEAVEITRDLVINLYTPMRPGDVQLFKQKYFGTARENPVVSALLQTLGVGASSG